MRRRTLLGRIGGASAAAFGATGLASANDGVTVVWEFDDGRVERLDPVEFERHPGTPSYAVIEASDCCDCTDCECRFPPCEEVK